MRISVLNNFQSGYPHFLLFLKYFNLLLKYRQKLNVGSRK